MTYSQNGQQIIVPLPRSVPAFVFNPLQYLRKTRDNRDFETVEKRQSQTNATAVTIRIVWSDYFATVPVSGYHREP